MTGLDPEIESWEEYLVPAPDVDPVDVLGPRSIVGDLSFQSGDGVRRRGANRAEPRRRPIQAPDLGFRLSALAGKPIGGGGAMPRKKVLILRRELRISGAGAEPSVAGPVHSLEGTPFFGARTLSARLLTESPYAIATARST